MDLKIIPYSDLRQTSDSETSEAHSQHLYNSHHHTIEELRIALSDENFAEPVQAQPWVLLDPFLDIITTSQTIAPEDVHIIVLPNRFLNVVEQVGYSGVLLCTLSSSSLEDLEDAFPNFTSTGIPLADLFDGPSSGTPRKYFARLSTSSLKDSRFEPSTSSKEVRKGSEPLTSVQQIWQRIATSARALRGIQDLRAAGVQMKLFLLPWDERIRPEHEYRVFCAPNGGQVTAVSEYRWFEPWIHADLDERGMEEKAKHVMDGVNAIHERLMRHPAVVELKLPETGFTFDVADVDGVVVLVELNDFGATTGCGSCLFHWLNDAKLLYGQHGKAARAKETHVVELRVLGGIPAEQG